MGDLSGVNYVAMDAAIRHSSAKGGPKLVLAVIARYVNQKTGKAYPSVGTIAELSGLSEKQVSRITRDLAKTGELKVDPYASPVGTNLYRLPKLDAWVNMSAELPDNSCKEQLEVYEEEGKKKVRKIKTRNRSQRVILSEAHADLVDDRVKELSYLFVDALIEAGRKDPRYRSDALDAQWLHDMSRLVEDMLWRFGQPRSIKDYEDRIAEAADLVKFAASSVIPGTTTWIRRPAVIRQHRADLLNQMAAESEAVAA